MGGFDSDHICGTSARFKCAGSAEFTSSPRRLRVSSRRCRPYASNAVEARASKRETAKLGSNHPAASEPTVQKVTVGPLGSLRRLDALLPRRFAALRQYQPESLLRRHRRQFEHASVFGRFGSVAALQREADGVELFCVFKRHGRRPALVAVVELDRHFSSVFAFMD
jgi:hypothetical protein